MSSKPAHKLTIGNSYFRYILNDNDKIDYSNPIQITIRQSSNQNVAFFDTKYPEFDDVYKMTYATHIDGNKFEVSDSRNIGSGTKIKIVDNNEKKEIERKREIERKARRRDEAYAKIGIRGEGYIRVKILKLI